MTATPPILLPRWLSFIFLLTLSSGCTTSAYFSTPNNTVKAKVILYLTDSSKIPGQISVPWEQYSSPMVHFQPYVDFIREGGIASERINLNNILGYAYGQDYFALKEVDISMNNIIRILFIKRLTPEKSKIQLYELYESGLGNPTGESRYSYYLSLPGYSPYKTINAKGIYVVPNFEEKVSKMVADCPALAEKIRNKEKGYFLPEVTFKAKLPGEVLLKIITEYNQCQ